MKIHQGECWPSWAAGLIQDEIDKVLRKRLRCSVMLTGGRSARLVYDAWSGLTGFKATTGVDFYFGDERCVAPESEESNFAMAMSSLFRNGVPAGCSVRRMEAERGDQEDSSRRYETNLPQAIDLLLLGVGEDGHIASLFRGSGALKETRRLVVPVSCPKPPRQRLTVTPPVIRAARKIFVLAPGPAKGRVLQKALAAPQDASSLPARLTLRGCWLLDTPIQPEARPEPGCPGY